MVTPLVLCPPLSYRVSIIVLRRLVTETAQWPPALLWPLLVLTPNIRFYMAITELLVLKLPTGAGCLPTGGFTIGRVALKHIGSLLVGGWAGLVGPFGPVGRLLVVGPGVVVVVVVWVVVRLWVQVVVLLLVRCTTRLHCLLPRGAVLFINLSRKWWLHRVVTKLVSRPPVLAALKTPILLRVKAISSALFLTVYIVLLKALPIVIPLCPKRVIRLGNIVGANVLLGNWGLTIIAPLKVAVNLCLAVNSLLVVIGVLKYSAIVK